MQKCTGPGERISLAGGCLSIRMKQHNPGISDGMSNTKTEKNSKEGPAKIAKIKPDEITILRIHYTDTVVQKAIGRCRRNINEMVQGGKEKKGIGQKENETE